MASIKVYFENVKQEEYLSSNDFYQVKDAVKFCEGSWYSSTTSKWSLDLTERTLEKLKFYMQKDKYDKYKEMLIKIQKVEVPQQFSFLYEFQKEGIKKLSARKILLCDEVGLGKTLQTAAFCEIMKFEKILIVVPAPLKYQWKEELLKHFNQESTIWEGTFLERKKIFNNFSMSSIKYFIINYEQLVNKNAFLNEEKWDFIILDEVHRVKNNKSIANKFVRKEFKGIRKVGLTATPLVNNLRELFTIANLLSDNTFMSWPTFENAFCVREIIHRRNPKTHDIEELNVIVNYKNTENFYKKLSPFMIRRKKNEVLAELPTRIYKEIRFDLNEIEKKKHGEFIELAKNAWKNDDAENILKYITHARQCCNSLEILPDELKVDAASSKIDALKAELEEIDDKVLIFTQFEKMARVIAREIGENKSVIISGATENKLEEIKKFKDSNLQYLISTDTLNYGVNLEFINKLIHFDLPWTPAKVEQREGRIDRITQQRGMLITKLIAKDSFDEHVANVIEKKKEIFQLAVDGTKEMTKLYFEKDK